MITRATLSTIEQGLPKYRSMLAGNAAFFPVSFDSIATATGTGSSNVITFSDIPSTYQHLQIRSIARSTVSGNNIGITFNNDTSANYSRHLLGGNGSSIFGGSGASENSITIEDVTADSGTGSNTMGVAIIDIHDYAVTTKNKTVRALSARENNGSGAIKVSSGLWINTSAITTISITANLSNFTTATIFALYGIKGS